jgi:ketosteroid isomerase-like protein
MTADDAAAIPPLKKRVYEIYEGFSSGNWELMANAFDDDVDFRSNAPIDLLPYLGHRVGKLEVMKALRAVHGEFQPVSFMPVWVVADIEAEAAAVLVSIHATQRSSERVIRLFAAHFLRFRNNRIVVYRAILDTFEAAQQVLGREFELGRNSERMS